MPGILGLEEVQRFFGELGYRFLLGGRQNKLEVPSRKKNSNESMKLVLIQRVAYKDRRAVKGHNNYVAHN